jgi:hypothetical protein
MQNGWSLGTIEQNGDAGRTMAYGDNDANLVSKVRATNSSDFAKLETRADCNPIHFQIHGCLKETDRNETEW